MWENEVTRAGCTNQKKNTEAGGMGERDASKVMNVTQICMIFASTSPLPTDGQMGHSYNMSFPHLQEQVHPHPPPSWKL